MGALGGYRVCGPCCCAGRTEETKYYMTATSTMDRSELDRIVQDYLDNRCTDAEADFLEANHPLWVDSLWRLLERADQDLERARQTSVHRF